MMHEEVAAIKIPASPLRVTKFLKDVAKDWRDYETEVRFRAPFLSVVIVSDEQKEAQK